MPDLQHGNAHVKRCIVFRNTMLPGASMCVKDEQCWVPRCSSAPRPMLASAAHVNEVIMWGCVELGQATEGFE